MLMTPSCMSSVSLISTQHKRLIHLSSRHLSNLNLLHNEIKVDSCLIAPYPFVRRAGRFFFFVPSLSRTEIQTRNICCIFLFLFLFFFYTQVPDCSCRRCCLAVFLSLVKKKIFFYAKSGCNSNHKAHLTSSPLLCWSQFIKICFFFNAVLAV